MSTFLDETDELDNKDFVHFIVFFISIFISHKFIIHVSDLCKVIKFSKNQYQP